MRKGMGERRKEMGGERRDSEGGEKREGEIKGGEGKERRDAEDTTPPLSTPCHKFLATGLHGPIVGELRQLGQPTRRLVLM